MISPTTNFSGDVEVCYIGIFLSPSSYLVMLKVLPPAFSLGDFHLLDGLLPTAREPNTLFPSPNQFLSLAGYANVVQSVGRHRCSGCGSCFACNFWELYVGTGCMWTSAVQATLERVRAPHCRGATTHRRPIHSHFIPKY